MAQLMNRWERRGWERGLTEGRNEGRNEGQQALILQLLERQCGVLSVATTERVRALPEDTLVALGQTLHRFEALPDVEAWRKAHETTK